MIDWSLSIAEEEALGVLRQADEHWLELWELSQRLGYGCWRTSRAVADLRRRGLVVKRPSERGLSRIEVSLSRGGIG